MKVEQWKIGDVDSTAALVQIGMNELYRRVIGHGIRNFASFPSFASFCWIACDFCVIAKYVCVISRVPVCTALHHFASITR